MLFFIRSGAEVRSHVLRGQIAFGLTGSAALCELAHKLQRGLRFFEILNVHNGVPAAAVLRQENGRTRR